MGKKVIVRLAGGLGNQMFNYAAARRLALFNEAELVLDNVSGFANDKKYKRSYQLDSFKLDAKIANSLERMEPFSRFRRSVIIRANQYCSFEKRNYIQEEGIGFDERLLNFKVKKNLYLDGVWQSEAYFRDISDTLREDFKFVTPKDSANLKMAEKIKQQKSVMVHVRFHDHQHLPEPFQILPEYYLRAFDLIEQLVEDPHYFIFSDDPIKVEQWLPIKSSNVTYVYHNKEDNVAYADLWLMTQCKYFIIANSTFSWWGAWLAEYSNKHVIAPNVFIHNYFPKWRGLNGVLPLEWIKI